MLLPMYVYNLPVAYCAFILHCMILNSNAHFCLCLLFLKYLTGFPFENNEYHREAQLFGIYLDVIQLSLTLPPAMPSKDTHTHRTKHTEHSDTIQIL